MFLLFNKLVNDLKVLSLSLKIYLTTMFSDALKYSTNFTFEKGQRICLKLWTVSLIQLQ